MKKFVFPDSSVFLHFSPLDEIDLLRFLETAEVEVLLTLVVTEELIHHQREHPVPGQRRRAKETLKRLEDWFEGQHAIGPGVTASFIGKQPGNETMERYRLNWQHQDDVLLGTLLEYKQARPDKAVILLAGDRDLALRARSLQIEVVEPPDDHILVETEYALKDERQTLRQGLADFRYHLPHLSLSFAGGKDKTAVAIAPKLNALTATMQDQLVAVADQMRREAAQHQADDEIEASLDDANAIATLVARALPAGRSFPGRMAEEEAERYRREIEAYPEKFERYLHRCLEIINLHRRSIRLNLEMKNAGGASAEDVVLMLTLPEQLEWHWQPRDGDMPAPPAPPITPEWEGQAVDRSFHIGRVSSVPSDLLGRDDIFGGASAGASPMISEEGTLLQWELGTYRHHQSRLLAPLYGRFRNADDILNFVIAWEIREKNRSFSVRGQLLVTVDTMMTAGEVDR